MRLLAVLLSVLLPVVLPAQPVIINELYNSGGSDEWIELLVTGDVIDLRGWDIRDFTSGGLPQDPLSLTSNSFWSGIGSGTVIMVVRPTAVFEEDFDFSDHTVVIRSDNEVYFEGSSFSFAGSSDAIQIRNTADEHMAGISWGTGNAGSLPEPKVHFAKTSASNTSVSFLGDTVTAFPDPASWLWNNGTPSPGLGNSPENTAWRNGLIVPANGSGMADILPDTVAAGSLFDMQVIYYRDPDHSVDRLRVVLPSHFPWSRNPDDVTVAGADGSLTLSGDTVAVTGITALEDSAVISVLNLGSGDSVGSFDVLVQTGVTAFVTLHPVQTITVSGITSVGPSAEIPAAFTLEQNYPNPFNPATRITYAIPESQEIVLTVYDLLGREVETLIRTTQPPGRYSIEWNGSGSPTGVYIYQMRAGERVATKRMVLLK